MRQYATAAELAAYPGGDAIPTEDADARLRTASRVVDECLKGVPYDVDTEGLPTDADVAQAMADAACAIALEAHVTGVLDVGSTQQWESVAIGSVQLSTLQGASASDAVTVLGLPVPPAAIVALRSIGSVQVWRCS